MVERMDLKSKKKLADAHLPCSHRWAITNMLDRGVKVKSQPRIKELVEDFHRETKAARETPRME